MSLPVPTGHSGESEKSLNHLLSTSGKKKERRKKRWKGSKRNRDGFEGVQIDKEEELKYIKELA